MSKPIAIDFDGVLHEFQNGWDGDVPKNPPIKDALWAVNTLRNAGHEVIIYTTRDPQHVKNWLGRYNFPLLEVTNTKPRALAYIDDRGIRFENNWQSIVKLFC